MKVIMNQPLRHENLPEFLRLVGHEDIYAPDHWSTFTGNLRNVSSNRGTKRLFVKLTKMRKTVIQI